MSAFIGVVIGVTGAGLFQLLAGHLEHRRRLAERRDRFMADTLRQIYFFIARCQSARTAATP